MPQEHVEVLDFNENASSISPLNIVLAFELRLINFIMLGNVCIFLIH